MPEHKPLQFLLLLLLLISTSLPPTVKSDPNPIQLPSESNLCPLADLPNACPVNCFRPDPVCGANGVTYWCGCADARCAGARVAKMGFCEVGNGASAQAFLLFHIVWLILLGIFVLFGLL